MTNFKTAEKPICEIISESSARYDPSDFEPFASAKSTVSESEAAEQNDEFALMGKDSGRELIDKCPFLQHCRDDAANLSEPMWYAAITNRAVMADWHDVVHEISKLYPKYSYRETEAEFRHAVEEDKPVHL